MRRTCVNMKLIIRKSLLRPDEWRIAVDQCSFIITGVKLIQNFVLKDRKGNLTFYVG